MSFLHEWRTARDDYERAIAVARSYGRMDGLGSTHWCDLSGEWADRKTGREVYNDVMSYVFQEYEPLDGSESREDDWLNDILDAYEDAYNTAAELTVEEEGGYNYDPIGNHGPSGVVDYTA